MVQQQLYNYVWQVTGLVEDSRLLHFKPVPLVEVTRPVYRRMKAALQSVRHLLLVGVQPVLSVVSDQQAVLISQVQRLHTGADHYSCIT